MNLKSQRTIGFLAIIVLLLLFGLGNHLSKHTGIEEEMVKVRLNEVVHSIFYAPQYVAIEKGYFAEEELDIELTTGWGADKSMTALISNNADIALMGPEASIYVYNEGQENYAVNFAQLTKCAGNFIIGRESEENFSIKDLKGKTIIGGRVGGMPQMVLEYILKENDLEPYKDVNIITNIDFSATAGSFMSGTGDYTVEFEPKASKLEGEGAYVVASLGVEGGEIPYTAYMATKDYIRSNERIIEKFTKAIEKAENWVDTHSAMEIAEVIAPHFEDTDVKTITKIVERYKKQETWCKTPLFEERSLELLQDILESAGELEQSVDYDDIVTTKYVK